MKLLHTPVDCKDSCFRSTFHFRQTVCRSRYVFLCTKSVLYVYHTGYRRRRLTSTWQERLPWRSSASRSPSVEARCQRQREVLVFADIRTVCHLLLPRFQRRRRSNKYSRLLRMNRRRTDVKGPGANSSRLVEGYHRVICVKASMPLSTSPIDATVYISLSSKLLESRGITRMDLVVSNRPCCMPLHTPL